MKTLLECFEKMKHLSLAKTIVIKSDSDLTKISFPYYMKASIGEHKIEKKAVLRIENLSEAKSEYNRLKKEFPNFPIVIQEQIIGIEMILGLKKDEVFEKILLIGFGGTNAETLKDVTFLSIPTSKPEIKFAIESLKLYPSLHKRQKYAIIEFINLAFEVSKLDFNELDLNPVILTEKKAVIVDARGD
ncbi:MAG: acetate--CoA ligase family protein [Candidatus Nanoarchaeia archaeon]|nr:acetate--CoA ligase family protein [Candidatus Nanoarchaeia archaeon]